MAVRGSLDLAQLQSLCDFDGEKYISKSGQAYVDALSAVFNLINKNDKPFSREDIIQQPLLNEFDFSGFQEFKFICHLSARPMVIRNGVRSNEKIVASDFADEEAKRIFNKALGVAYVITCVIDGNEYIIKFGQSRTTFKQRLGSYNCGVVFNWRTASTTNIKILQSMVATRLKFNLYLYDCSTEQYILNWHGERSVPFASPKSLAVEDIMVKKFSELFDGRKPLANVQANATQVLDD